MRKCTGNNTHEWEFDAIFEVMCNHCGARVEFFKDEITRNCPECTQSVTNDRKDFWLLALVLQPISLSEKHLPRV